MQVTIEYCNRWGYREKAASLAEQIRKRFAGEVRLLESSGGVFEVTVDGALLYSKKQTGEFPDQAALLKQMEPVW